MTWQDVCEGELGCCCCTGRTLQEDHGEASPEAHSRHCVSALLPRLLQWTVASNQGGGEKGKGLLPVCGASPCVEATRTGCKRVRSSPKPLCTGRVKGFQECRMQAWAVSL